MVDRMAGQDCEAGEIEKTRNSVFVYRKSSAVAISTSSRLGRTKGVGSGLRFSGFLWVFEKQREDK
jgi:hypothetical protein